MKKTWKKLADLWRKFWRMFFTLPLVQWLGAALGFASIRFAQLTCRIQYKNPQIIKKYGGAPAIYAFWHGRSMMLSAVLKKFGFRGYAIFSQHRDGRLMAKMQRMFGLRGIYGSTGRKGAVAVLREGVRVIKEGHFLCLSPDGPRGPRMRIHDGALYFAKMTGAPIIPLCFTCDRPWLQWRRWDKYMLATPFSKVIIEAGEPFYIGKDDDIEIARVKLEQIMIEQLQKLDAIFDLPRIEPADRK
ncbi:MAG: lysophospholipid acyltransferase family protein [Alphaproteobacteria bacterium]|nr:lysophospholipid acyltransferase family protein [Alphaproteobacteria bacterium]MCL2890199.1 lysophospholipid acyltransferase family protein [Alphaproteobacteria bacterium]